MVKKGKIKKNRNKNNKKNHPVFRQHLTMDQKAADKIAGWGGSWTFIAIFILLMIIWILTNVFLLKLRPFDPYPFILLNLLLSTLAALQAPVILMAQNRQAERDRINARYDYLVNRKAEREIQRVQKDITKIKGLLEKLK